MSEGPPPLKPGERPIFTQPEHEYYKAAAGNPDHSLAPTEDLRNVEAEDPIEADPHFNAILKPRYKEIARQVALGKKYTDIAESMGYTPCRITELMKRPAFRAEVARYRNKLYDQDLVQAMKDLGPDALTVVETLIRDGGNEKLSTRADASRWLLEKLTGKAKQEITHESGTLAAFMSLMQQMQKRGEPVEAPPEREVIAAPTQSESPVQEADFTEWIDSNLK